jgi:hypothetical protein
MNIKLIGLTWPNRPSRRIVKMDTTSRSTWPRPRSGQIPSNWPVDRSLKGRPSNNAYRVHSYVSFYQWIIRCTRCSEFHHLHIYPNISKSYKSYHIYHIRIRLSTILPLTGPTRRPGLKHRHLSKCVHLGGQGACGFPMASGGAWGISQLSGG